MATLNRETNETCVSLTLNLDGQGRYKINTGNGMFDHLLTQFSKHGLLNLELSSKGDTETGWHHLVEDTAIVLGRSLRKAVGEGRGINRMGHAYVPLDEALALSIIDFSGRGFSVIDATMGDSDLAGLPASLVKHFLETFSREGGFNLHIKLISGENNHHKAEAIFKSLGRAMRQALELDSRLTGEIPSTKGTIT